MTALELIIEIVLPYTKTSRERLAAMAKACQQIEADELEGDVVECGVWRAGNIILARMLCPERVCWLFDTFEGMAGVSSWDVTRGGITIEEGKAAVSLDEVKNNFTATGTFDADKLRFVQGRVEKTLRKGKNLPKRIALLRLDTDWYWSTRAELEALWPRLVPGGILIIDDYGHWLGARKAVDDYFRRSIPLQRIDYTAVMAVKPNAA